MMDVNDTYRSVTLPPLTVISINPSLAHCQGHPDFFLTNPAIASGLPGIYIGQFRPPG